MPRRAHPPPTAFAAVMLAGVGLAACDVMPAGDVAFACLHAADCLPGYACIDERCIDPTSFAGDGGRDPAPRRDAGPREDEDGGGPREDGGARDGGRDEDGGAGDDAGPDDAADAGDVDDGGAQDLDAGFIDDAGPPDAGERDAGAADAGPPCVDLDDDGRGVGCPGGPDNCEAAANPDQHDEDEDGVGDACDVCPVDDDPAQLDADLDGVGDACDPRPAEHGDAIVAFEPFQGAALGPAWVQRNGTWRVENDELVLDSTADRQLIELTGLSLPDLRVEAAIRPTQLGAEPWNVGVVARMNVGDGYLCSIYRDAGQGSLALWRVDDNGVIFAASTTMSPPTVGTTYRVRSTITSNQHVCALPDDGISDSFAATSYPQGGAGIRANRVAVRVPFLIVYRVGP